MKILLITETYPPDLDPGALSIGKLVHACISAGHHVTVVTRIHEARGQGGTDTSTCWREILDYAVRVPDPVQRGSRLMMGGLARVWARVPGVGAWTYAAYRAARSLVAAGNFDCVMTGYVPFRTALVGDALKREFSIPWVVRFPDPSPVCLYPAPYGTGNAVTARDRYIVRRMKGVLRKANALITPSERMAAYINAAYDGAFGDRLIVLPHVGWSRPSNGQEKPGTIQVMHPGMKMHGRESGEIVAALRRALETARALGIDVRVTFAGYVSGEKTLPQKMKDLGDRLDWISPKSYEESLAQMAGATALLLVEAVMQEGVFLPSKVADYAVSRKPVLMFSPESGTIADLVGGPRHPGFLTQNPECASNRLVEFCKRAAAGSDLDEYRFPRPWRFHSDRVISVLMSGLIRHCGVDPHGKKQHREHLASPVGKLS